MKNINQIKRELIVLCGHGIYSNDKYSIKELSKNENWKKGFNGEGLFYVSHLNKSYDIYLLKRKESVVILSGGFTCESVKISEASSCLNILKNIEEIKEENFSSELKIYKENDIIIQKLELKSTKKLRECDYKDFLLEEYARNSFENLLFSLILFKKTYGYYPECIKIISWRLKEERFNLHWKVLQKKFWNALNKIKFQFIGVSYIPFHEKEAIEGEKAALKQWIEFPFGKGEKLNKKNDSRDPHGLFKNNKYYGCELYDVIL